MHYTNVLSVHIILAIITILSSLFFFRDWETPGVGSNPSEVALVPWWEREATPGPKLSTCTKEKAESILTDFQFWQTVVSSKETKPRAAVVFWARQLIVSMDFIVIQAKKTVFTSYYSAAPHWPGLSGDVVVSGWICPGLSTGCRVDFVWKDFWPLLSSWQVLNPSVAIAQSFWNVFVKMTTIVFGLYVDLKQFCFCLNNLVDGIDSLYIRETKINLLYFSASYRLFDDSK